TSCGGWVGSHAKASRCARPRSIHARSDAACGRQSAAPGDHSQFGGCAGILLPARFTRLTHCNAPASFSYRESARPPRSTRMETLGAMGCAQRQARGSAGLAMVGETVRTAVGSSRGGPLEEFPTFVFAAVTSSTAALDLAGLESLPGV